MPSTRNSVSGCSAHWVIYQLSSGAAIVCNAWSRAVPLLTQVWRCIDDNTELQDASRAPTPQTVPFVQRRAAHVGSIGTPTHLLDHPIGGSVQATRR